MLLKSRILVRSLAQRITENHARHLHSTARAASSSKSRSALSRQTNTQSQTVRVGRLRMHIHDRHLAIARGPHSSSSRLTHARLRDNCRCAQCVDPSTRQRTLTSGSEVVRHAAVRRALAGFDARGHAALHVTWTDGHESVYPTQDLDDMTLGDAPEGRRQAVLRRTLWDRATLLESDLRVPYDKVQSPEGLLRLLTQVQGYGVAIIEGVPTDLTDDRACELRRFIQTIGPLRNTFYGETWDVRSMPQSKNVAYTSVNLGLHMDLLYFSSPPRFQALHCLRNKVVGGSSYISDSFLAARKIIETMPDVARILTTSPIRFEYDNDGHFLRHHHTLLTGTNLDALKAAVNWSPPFQGYNVQPVQTRSRTRTRPVPLDHRDQDQQRSADFDTHERDELEFYDALHTFEQLIHQDSVQYEYTMREGDLMLFDNRRVLHARRAFRDMTPEERGAHGITLRTGEPTRWLKGCYMDGEALWDKLMVLAASAEAGAATERGTYSINKGS